MKKGYSQKTLSLIWSEISNAVAGGYSFNKSHSASYAVISYQTAWLKCHYPEHFYASLMTGEKTDGPGQDAIAGYIAECKKRGINILPPDINLSGDDFVVAKRGVNYRITTIKHVGESAISHIKELRTINSFDDFMQRREKKHIKKNVLINLIKAGCFDFDEPNRAELLWQVDMLSRNKTQIKEGYEPPRYRWDDKTKAEWEKEVLGMYLSTHPLERYGFHALDHYKDGEYALQGGEVSSVRVFNDRNKNEMAFAFLSTLYGNLKVVIFTSLWRYEHIQNAFQQDNILLIKGKRSGNDIILDEVEILEEKQVTEGVGE